MMMPKVAIFLSILLLSSTITNSYAFSLNGLESVNNSHNQIILDSDIVTIDPNFLIENDFKIFRKNWKKENCTR